jgi:hypothetical protein
VKIEKGVKEIKIDKKQGINEMPRPKNNDYNCEKYTHSGCLILDIGFWILVVLNPEL